MYWNIPSGAEVNVVEYGDEWTKISIGRHVGYMRTKYLLFSDTMFGVIEDTETNKGRQRLKDIYQKIGDMIGVHR